MDRVKNREVLCHHYREAVDDVRYIATLTKALQKAQKVKAKSTLATEAEKWMKDIDPAGDLDAIRKTAAEWVVQLHGNRKQPRRY